MSNLTTKLCITEVKKKEKDLKKKKRMANEQKSKSISKEALLKDLSRTKHVIVDAKKRCYQAIIYYSTFCFWKQFPNVASENRNTDIFIFRAPTANSALKCGAFIRSKRRKKPFPHTNAKIEIESN